MMAIVGGKLMRTSWRESKALDFLEWAESHMDIKSHEDWYNISREALEEIGGTTIIKNFGNSMYNMLCHFYPFYHWLPWKFKRVGSIQILCYFLSPKRFPMDFGTMISM
jgi:hypothetical protein